MAHPAHSSSALPNLQPDVPLCLPVSCHFGQACCTLTIVCTNKTPPATALDAMRRYGEYYGEMSDFHELLPKLLKPGGVYSFFNGLAPDNIFFHTVEGRVAQLELETLGLTTSYERVAIKEAIDEEVWKGVKNKYWKLPFYFLPTCVFNTPQQS
eukprot:1155527-Pelagomonas_calceolata.AAC.2